MPDDLTLSDDNRTKLDGIVQKMQANKESDANIQFVVNDFKQKYGTSSATDPQKKNSVQSNSATSQTSASNSGSAQQQGSQQQGASGYEWSNGDANQTKFATGGVQGMDYKNLFSPETAEKLNGEKPTVYVAKKANQIAKYQGDLEEHNTTLQNFNFSDNFKKYQELNTQLQALPQNDPTRPALQAQVDELKKQPFDVRPSSFAEADQSQDELRKKRLPANMQNIKTVGDAADLLDDTKTKADKLKGNIAQNAQDIQGVVQPLQEVHGIKLDKEGYHELGLYGSFMNGFMGNLESISKAASLIGASPEKKQQVYQDAMGAEIIDPEKANYPTVQMTGGVLPYAIPGLGLEAAGAKGAVATIGNAFINGTMMGLSSGFENGYAAYKAALTQSNDPNAALQSADKAFKTGAVTGAAVGGIGLPLAGAVGEHIAFGALDKEAVEAAMQDGKLKLGNLSLAEYAAYTLPKNAIANLPFPLAKIIDNKFAQARGENVSTMDNVASTYFGALLMGHMIDGLTYGGEKLSPKVKEAYQNMIAKYGNEGFQQSVSQSVANGDMTQQQADVIAQPINDKAMAFAEMPKDLSPEVEKKVLPLVQQKNELIRQQSENKVLPDEHFTNKIEDLDRKINETLGTPLTNDEQLTLETLRQRTKDKGEDGKVKKPLTPTEKDLLKHLETREDASKTANRPDQVDNSAPTGKKVSAKTTSDATTDEQVNSADKAAPVKVGKAQFSEHGEDELTAHDKENGTGNSALTETGKAEAAKQGEDIAKAQPNLKTIYTSDVTRSKETGAIAAESASKEVGHDVSVVEQPLLATWNIGDAEGKKDGSFDEKAWAAKPDEAPPGGESWNSFAERAKKAWEWAKTLGDDAHGITHSKMTRMFEALNEADGDMGKAKELFFKSLDAEEGNAKELEPSKTDEPETDTLNPEGKTAGMSNRVMSKVAERLGIDAPNSGKGVTPAQAKEYGRALLKEGADPQKIIDDFNNDPLKKTSYSEVAILNARHDELVADADKAADKYGIDSPEYNAASKVTKDLAESIQPFKTEWSKQGAAMQGEIDTETGSFASLRNAFETQANRPATTKELAKIKELSGQVENANKKYQDAIDELNTHIQNAAIEQDANEKKIAELEKKLVPGKKYTVGAKRLADKVRDLKTKPFTFIDSDGKKIEINAGGGLSLTPVVWNHLLDATARGIELTGKVADAVKNAIDEVKDADWYRDIKDKAGFAKKLEEHFADKETETDIHTRFASKTDSKFDPKEVKAIWDYAKENYLDKGKNPQDMVRGVATDLGLTQKQVQEAISLPKTQRKITDEMYTTQRNRNKAVRNAKDFVEQAGMGKVAKFWNLVSRAPDGVRALVTWGHGTVGVFTHAGLNLFDPTIIKQNLSLIFHTYDSAYGAVVKEITKGTGLRDFEQRVSNFTADPQYADAMRHGLDIDAAKVDTDYAPANTLWGKSKQVANNVGDRGFFELKPYRLELYKKAVDSLPEVIKSDPTSLMETKKMLASMINNATGVGPKSIADKLPAAAIFAPKLVSSQVARLIVEPAQAGNTLLKMAAGEATPAERAALKIYGQHTIAMVGAYAAALAINNELLKLTGGGKVNYTDTSKPDFLRMKTASGRTIDASSGIISMFKFLYHIGQVPFLSLKDARGDRVGKVGQLAINELRGKASPFAGVVADLVSGKDFDGNVLPGRNDAPKPGAHKMTLGEYLLHHLTPIPAQETFKEKNHDAGDYLSGLISGITGVKIGDKPKK